jgi:hypothetical protein
MARSIGWLMILAVGVGSLCRAGQPAPAPLSRPLTDEKAGKGTGTKKGEETHASNPTPVLFPTEPFPPPAPPVIDPRTCAWQQVWSPHGEEMAIHPHHPEPVPVSAPPSAPISAAPAASPPTGLRAWLQRVSWQPEREKTLEMSRNQQTGEWNIVEVSPHR